MPKVTDAAVPAGQGRDFSSNPHTVFVSDIHLDERRPEVTAQLFAFLHALPASTERLYIVGDLFEAWIGDDAPGSLGEETMTRLHALSARGIRGFFTQGNRDFLVGEGFAARTGFTVLPDEALIDCYGEPVLLMHGDTLCTDDTDYQTLRATLRNPAFQQQLLAMSVPQRLELAQQLRAASASEMSNKTEDIMDANPAAVIDALERHGVVTLLHGHTHRPAVHTLRAGDKAAQRIVLGDWFDQGSVVFWDADGFELQRLAREA